MLRRKRRRAGGAFEEFEASGRVPLACQGSAERVVLLGREDDRREEGGPTFACGVRQGANLRRSGRAGAPGPVGAGARPESRRGGKDLGEGGTRTP